MWRFQQWNRDSLLQLWLNPGFLQWKQSPVLWPLWPALPRLVKTPGIWSGYPLSPGPPCGTLPSSSGTRRFELTLAKGCTESAWCSSDKAWNKLQLQKNLRGSSRCFGWESGHQTRWSYCCWTAGCCETKKNKTKPNFQQPKGTVGKNHSTHSTFKACRDFKKNSRKGKSPGGRTLTWSPPLNDHNRDQGSGCSNEWIGVAERVNQVSRLVHLIEREGIKSAEIIGSNSLIRGSEWH